MTNEENIQEMTTGVSAAEAAEAVKAEIPETDNASALPAETEGTDKPKKARKFKKLNEAGLEIVIAIFLSITALLTAWSTWVGGLHGSNQASNYAESNNLQTEGNGMWNEATQSMIQDMLLWNDISSLQVVYLYYDEDNEEKELAAYQLYFLCEENLSQSMADAIGWDFNAVTTYADPTDYIPVWLENENAMTTPFADTDYINSYYTEAQATLDQAEDLLVKGNDDNANADKYGLATVFFSVVLFLLGIAGTFKNLPNRKVVVAIGIIVMVIGIIYMVWVPLPRGFAFTNYFTK